MDRLVTLKQAAEILGMSPRSFERKRPGLVARGLQQVRDTRKILYRASSLEKVIDRACTFGTLLPKEVAQK